MTAQRGRSAFVASVVRNFAGTQLPVADTYAYAHSYADPDPDIGMDAAGDRDHYIVHLVSISIADDVLGVDAKLFVHSDTIVVVVVIEQLRPSIELVQPFIIVHRS